MTDVDHAHVGALLADRARRHGDGVLVRCGEASLTFAEADERATAIAGGLADIGVDAGERVAVMAANRLEVVELFLACARLGAVQVPVNIYFKGSFLAHQLSDSRPTVIVVDDDGRRAVAPLLEDGLLATEDPTLVCLDEVPDDAPAAALGYGSLQRGGTPPAVALGPDSLHSIVYTSGTTGLPKGCMLSHGYHTHAAAASGDMTGYHAEDVVLTALPMYHQWARGTLLGALHHGMTAVIDPQFSASGWLDRVLETGASVFMGVGAMGQAILATTESDRDAETRLRCAFMIPFPPEASAAWQQRFGCPVFSQMYGQTETGAITYSPLGSDAPPGSIGRPSPHFEVALLDAEDHPVEPGEVGEIAVRPRVPHSVYQGYWDRPGATVGAWRNLWHHTGDLARADEDGHLFFVDRRSDALRRRGENVSSLQLEQALLGHEDIERVAVHAVPSEMTEDDIMATVVPAADHALAPEPLFAFMADVLPYYALPRYVELVEELPTTATMRVRKHELRERGVTDSTWDLEELGLTVDRDRRR